jgi:CspA family cold shock protein
MSIANKSLSKAAEREREKGHVKWFDPAKGYGFVLDGNGESLFMHKRSLNVDVYKTLEPNDDVTFEIVDTPKGLQAVSVSLATK